MDAQTRRMGLLAAMLVATGFAITGCMFLIAVSKHRSASRESTAKTSEPLPAGTKATTTKVNDPSKTVREPSRDSGTVAPAPQPQKRGGTARGAEEATTVLLVLGGLVALVAGVFGAGWQRSCPRCSRLFARWFRRTVEVSRERCYGLVTRVARTFGTTNLPGGPGQPSQQATTSSTTTWQERVPVIRRTLRHDYACRYCRHTWHQTEVNEEEDFSRA